ncbi:class I adenylate-forming enzyme family protein [Sphingosinicella microcystinivorans]|uniref:Acyl-CoA synthetase (AMP-forming)/AMP-acid ligase II n=1 Tax=Sphingosinicella microcystinivorans TaxID=335406 RepID=A0ABX9SZM2_SPHMI|nr:class I adenylate-forming enzyme family protein [Sphingosinicella microcystinivorans]RKS89288.1 acyl-CoA synthetase (AMP-forming)/AMP-acid ligase II [Sphingosinicella microcystinivorans]
MSERFASGNLGDIIRIADVATDGAYVDMASEPPAGRVAALPELATAVAALAGGFAGRFARGTRVAILARNGLAFTQSYLALMQAGLVAVPLSWRMPADTIAFMLSDAACKAVLCDAEFAHLLPDGLPRIDLAGDDFAALGRAAPIAPVVPEAGEECEILYTSGSTGRPKGVALDHHGQMWALKRFLAASGDAMERTIIVAPAYHMNGLFFTTVALALGWRAYSLPGFDPRGFLELAAQERCTMLSGIPTMFAMMARESDLIERLDFSSVKSVLIGSAPLTQPLIVRVKDIFPHAEVRNSYGTTECGPAMFGPHPGGLPRPPLALGFPYPDVEWRLEDGSESEGRLVTRTPAVFARYLNLPDVTASRLSDGWYDTGDIVRRDSDGFFHFVGRADDMFVCGGENIYPGEVEKLIERHPAVLQAAVLPASDPIKGAIPIAFVVAAEGAQCDPEDVKRFTLEHGPAYAHPRAVVLLDALPVGGTHKVDRKALEPLAENAARKLGRG